MYIFNRILVGYSRREEVPMDGKDGLQRYGTRQAVGEYVVIVLDKVLT